MNGMNTYPNTPRVEDDYPDPQLTREGLASLSEESFKRLAGVIRLDWVSVDRDCSSEFVRGLAYDVDTYRDEAMSRGLVSSAFPDRP